MKGRLYFCDEFLVGRGAVGGDAEDDHAALLEVGEEVAEAAGLLRAAGRVVLGVEVDEHVLAGDSP